MAAAGLTPEELAFRPDADANSIAWLIWHLTRIHDDHVADILEEEQVWLADDWHSRLGFRFDAHDTGYGHTSEQVSAVRPHGPDGLLAYLDTVTSRTLEYLDSTDNAPFDRIIDRSWNPPVTVGVRLVSVVGDSHQHVEQANYLRGIIDRAGRHRK